MADRSFEIPWSIAVHRHCEAKSRARNGSPNHSAVDSGSALEPDDHPIPVKECGPNASPTDFTRRRIPPEVFLG